MRENKQDIVAKLSQLLKSTRAGEDIDKLELATDESTVRITFLHGYERTVNVECDSGIAIIEDVIRHLL
ncbi:MAG: hypothetical protein NC389_09685 [Acetatifactor muris]|nr:hypothetical protein [Acetatifactor muris]